MTTDVIDSLAGIAPGSSLDAARARRPAARDNAQRSYEVLFTPDNPGTVTLAERLGVALFVTGLHGHADLVKLYRDQLAAHVPPALIEAIEREVKAAATEGPYGTYPEGPLSGENKAGLIYRVSQEKVSALGTRLAAALAHAHFLVFRPRDASPKALQALLDAGWTTTEVVTISQIVAFLSFQIRVAHGLRVLAASGQSANTGFPATAVAAE